jgi:hypothetical protein
MPRRKSAASLLIGTWRSDRKRTVAQWVYPKRLAAARRKSFEAIFGKMQVRYTRSRHTSKFEGRTWTAPYRVLWSREGPVFPQIALLFKGPDGETLQHIYFDSPNSYYIHAGKCIEFFTRVRSNKSLERTRAK